MLPPQMHHWFQVLLLSMNQLVTLPPEIAALTALTHLDVSLNSITGLTATSPRAAQHAGRGTNGPKILHVGGREGPKP